MTYGFKAELRPLSTCSALSSPAKGDTKSKKERLFRKIFRKSRSETPSISHLFRPKGPLSEGAGNAAGIDWGSYHAKPHLEK